MTDRWPKGRFGKVTIWNRYIQSFDHRSRDISLNRKQTTLGSEGTFEIILADEDPGEANERYDVLAFHADLGRNRQIQGNRLPGARPGVSE